MYVGGLLTNADPIEILWFLSSAIGFTVALLGLRDSIRGWQYIRLYERRRAVKIVAAGNVRRDSALVITQSAFVVLALIAMGLPGSGLLHIVRASLGVVASAVLTATSLLDYRDRRRLIRLGLPRQTRALRVKN